MRVRIAVLAGAMMLGGCAGVIRERLYRPVAIAQTPVTFTGAEPWALAVTTADGLRLSGYHWPAEAGRATVVYFHGNGFNQRVGAARAEALRAGGHGVIVASYRGYGGNPGRPSERGLMRDGDAWIAEARRLGAGRPLFLFGHSLGGSIALEMAARHPVAGVATLGTYARLADVAPPLARGLLPDKFDNRAAIARVRAPVLLIHGTNDTVVPFAAAERLRAASGGRAQVIRLPSAGHQVDLRTIAGRLWQAWDGEAPAGSR